MPVPMLILVCCYLGCHLRRGQGGNAAGRTRGGVTCTDHGWDTHISSQPIAVAISSPRRQTDGRGSVLVQEGHRHIEVCHFWDVTYRCVKYKKVRGASTHFGAHRATSVYSGMGREEYDLR